MFKLKSTGEEVQILYRGFGFSKTKSSAIPQGRVQIQLPPAAPGHKLRNEIVLESRVVEEEK